MRRRVRKKRKLEETTRTNKEQERASGATRETSKLCQHTGRTRATSLTEANAALPDHRAPSMACERPGHEAFRQRKRLRREDRQREETEQEEEEEEEEEERKKEERKEEKRKKERKKRKQQEDKQGHEQGKRMQSCRWPPQPALMPSASKQWLLNGCARCSCMHQGHGTGEHGWSVVTCSGTNQQQQQRKKMKMMMMKKMTMMMMMMMRWKRRCRRRRERRTRKNQESKNSTRDHGKRPRGNASRMQARPA